MIQKIITILFLSGDPVSIDTIATILNVKVKEIEEQFSELEKVVESTGLSLLQSKEGIALVTSPTQATLVEAFWREELHGDLSPAALQVLTLVAYLDNPTRETISYIRGTQSALSIRSLSVRGLISKTGEVCSLTPQAMKFLGITDVRDLPDYETIRKGLMEKLEAREV